MSRRIQITNHLSVEELGERFRQSNDVVERGHYQIIWLLAQGRSTVEVARCLCPARSRAHSRTYLLSRSLC